MADYRGGDRHGSSYGEALNKAIREGRTERQRSRNFDQKLAMAGVQGGLTLLAGGAKAAHSRDLRDEQKAKDVAEYANSPVQNYKPMADAPGDAKLPGWLTGQGGDTTEYAIDNDVTSALKPDDDGNPYKMPKPKPAEPEPYKAPVTWGEDEESKKRRGRGMMGSQ